MEHMQWLNVLCKANFKSVADFDGLFSDDVIALTANTGKAKRQGNRRVKGGLAFSKHDDTRGFQGRAVHVNGWGYKKDRGFRGQERWRGRSAGAQRKVPHTTFYNTLSISTLLVDVSRGSR